MIKAGIFDVGGVLIDWQDKPEEEDIKETLGISEEVFRKAWNELIEIMSQGTITEHEFWKRFLNATKSSKPLPEKSLFMREFEKRFKPHTEVLELVHSLHEKGVKTCVLSNTIEPHVEFLESHGIYKDFDVRILSNEVRITKPNPEILKTAREEKGFTLDEVERKIKIRQEYLSAIEKGDFSRLPSEGVSTGFVRNYAKFLDIPVSQAIPLFRREYKAVHEEHIVPNFRKTQHKFRKPFVFSANSSIKITIYGRA